MKKAITIIKYFALVILVGIVGMICYLKFVLPKVGSPENIRVELSPERIERGNYLANSVSVCMDCHSKRDWNKFAGPIIEGTYGQGGEKWSREIGLPGSYYARNITPFALQNWTDGEILRAVACGVHKNGKALFPLMPYLNYGKLDRDDLYSIIAFIRTLNPIENMVPESDSDFPMNFIINTIPKKPDYSHIPEPGNRVAYGSYIFTAATCGHCHTKLDKGQPVIGMELAGGFEFPLFTGGVVRSANITPDKETGIGNWSEELFVSRFKLYADSTYKPNAINNGDFNTPMPWMMYSMQKTEDLKAMYSYLMTVKPVKNSVIRFAN